MKGFLKIAACFLLLFGADEIHASHIVGGEFNYIYVGNNTYEVTLHVYRDCYNGIPPFDNPAKVGVFDSLNNRVASLNMPLVSIDTIPLEISDSCIKVPSGICYEVGTYQDTVTLPPRFGKVLLSYERCCWNLSVTNIKNDVGNGGGDAGITITAYISDTTDAPFNNSAVFSDRTPPYVCVGETFEFKHTAVDLDGDSLVYELFTPYNGQNGGSSFPSPPPYGKLIYIPPYSLNNVMGGVPLSIDINTGVLTATPSNEGQFVFGVKVNEYRDSRLIGYVARSYQLNVIQCEYETEAHFDTPVSQCGDSVVNFLNNSNGAKSYLWHFGDQGSTDTTSTDKNPVHHFSGIGSYTVSLIAYSDLHASCHDTILGTVNIYPPLEGDFEWSEEKCDNRVHFRDLTVPAIGVIKEWDWSFGDGGSSPVANPSHNYDLLNQDKTYDVRLIVTSTDDCVDTIYHEYHGQNRLFLISTFGATKTTIFPKHDSTLLYARSQNAVSYKWSPPTGLGDPNTASTIAQPKKTTTYMVTAKDDRGCIHQDSVTIYVTGYSCGETELFTPNAFTPNSDGENDYYRIRGEEIRSMELSIYNRWGENVFKSQDVGMLNYETMGWDGFYKGSPAPSGVYVYTLEVECNDARKFNIKGNISLLR